MELVVELFYLVSILLFGLILRAIPHIRYYYPGMPDTFFFLNKIKDPNYLSDEVLYPKLFDQTIRFFVRAGKFVDGRNTNRFSIVLDAITASIIYLFVRSQYITEIALLTILLFLTTPSVVKQGSTLSARSFGLLLVSTALLCVTLPFPWNWIAIVPIAMTLLAHRLSAQTLFVIFVGLSILKIQLFLIFITGFLLAILVSRGEYVKILRAHITTIVGHIYGNRYPNERLIGIVKTPTFIGYFIYLFLFIIQSYTSIVISIGPFTLPELIQVNPLFESSMIIWASACFVLLIIWVAGESYKHLSIAAAPFAFLTSLLTLAHQIFLVLAIILILGSLIQCVYFQLRFDNIDKNLIELLKHPSLIDNQSTMFTPKKVYRAVSFFTDCKVVPVILNLYTQENFDNRFQEYNPTLAVGEKKYGYWYSDWEEIESSGDWVLYRLK
jgi:hypothetical protein